MVRIGLISDTHGLLRPEAMRFLTGANHVIHGGDVGDRAILDALGTIAPVTAVRGNNDLAGWEHLAVHAALRFEEVLVYALHDVKELRPRSLPPGVRVVISGHSHQPSVSESGGILYVIQAARGRAGFACPSRPVSSSSTLASPPHASSNSSRPDPPVTHRRSSGRPRPNDTSVLLRSLPTRRRR